MDESVNDWRRVVSDIAFISFGGTLLKMNAPLVKLPTLEESQQAQEAARVLSRLLKRKTVRPLQVQSQGGKEVTVTVPREAFELLVDILGQMANGNAVSIVPVHAELTTQQAAEMLNVSRPFLVKLLDDGKIAFRMVGTHRRVRVADLLAYQRQDAAYRKGVADELAAQAQEHDLGY